MPNSTLVPVKRMSSQHMPVFQTHEKLLVKSLKRTTDCINDYIQYGYVREQETFTFSNGNVIFCLTF